MRRRLLSELLPSNRRIESFSDGVFAIAVTIMVLEIRIPDSFAFTADMAALERFAGLLITYTLSFVSIAIFWANHHYLVFTLPNADRATVWLNSHVLFWVTMVPIVARFFGLHPTSANAAAVYAFVIMMCTVAMSLLRAHALRISRNRLHRAVHRGVFPRARVAIALYAAAIPIAYLSTPLAWILLLTLPSMFFLPVVRGSVDRARRPARTERLAHASEAER